MISAQRRPVAPSLAASPEKRGIPFDYAFRFTLEGIPDRIVNSIVTVSIEAPFTAVSIGYGFRPKTEAIVFGPPPPPPIIEFALTPSSGRSLRGITLDAIIDGLRTNAAGAELFAREAGLEAVFTSGIRLNPDVAELALANDGTTELTDDVLRRLFQVVNPTSDLIQFKYAIFDEGSGREFQSEPILNIAGLGSSTGQRPFRHFAQPIAFRPRSTIRMEVTEASESKGELTVALHGYKVLGDQNSPTAVGTNRPGPRRRR